MKIIKKFTAIQLETKKVDYEIQIALTYGNMEGPNYNVTYPKQEFDSEEEAIEYAYKNYKYGNYLILPIVRFDN